jgi:hypothetical protein
VDRESLYCLGKPFVPRTPKASKTVSGGFVRRGFKSLPLRLTEKTAGNGGFSLSEFAEFAENPNTIFG